MTDETIPEEAAQLIAKQQLQIERLSQKLETATSAAKSATRIMTCVGGPLNDNVLRYSPKQLGTFQRIYDELRDVAEGL